MLVRNPTILSWQNFLKMSPKGKEKRRSTSLYCQRKPRQAIQTFEFGTANTLKSGTLKRSPLRVEKLTYGRNKARVHINPEKWFEGAPAEVWEYHIGGYQVSDKWLKDRKGRSPSSEEVAHYTRVVTAIGEAIIIQKSLDNLFAEVETSLLEVRL